MDDRQPPSRTATLVAVIARSLVDAPFLDRLRTEPDGVVATMELPVDVRADVVGLDAERLGLVAAYVCKVRHNDLWDHLPRTRAMLRERGEELEMFAAYARSPRPNRDRPGEFVEFLLHHLDAAGRGRDLLGDVARHELALHRLRSHPRPAAPPDDAVEPAGTRAGCPSLRGLVAVERFWHDPASFAAADGSSAPPADRPSADPVFAVYGCQPGDEPRLFRVDPLTALALSAVDGDHTVHQIADAIGCDDEMVSDVVRWAADLGLVERGPDLDAGPETDAGLQTLFAGYFATRALHAAHRTGVLDGLGRPRHVEEVAAELSLDPVWLHPVLELLARRTPVVERLHDGRYRSVSLDYERLGFALDKFIGAYGPCLDVDGPAGDAVDEDLLATAFERVTAEIEARHDAPSPTVLLLEHWGVAADVVDLGCGAGGVLGDLAHRNPRFRGIGVDANVAMCDAARAALARRGVADQVQILHGDAALVLSTVDHERRATVTALHGRSFFNACFGAGAEGASATVRAVADAFPGRLLFVDDYYGELARPAGSSPCGSWAELQDVVQAWSGQGVPPTDRREWAEVYAAGGRLLHSYEDDIEGFRRFIHVVRLDGGGAP